MKKDILYVQAIVRRLLQPSGSFAEGFLPYEPRDRPILCYEQLLYLLTFAITILTKVVATFNNKAAYISPLRTISLVIIVLIMLLELVRLLFSPRLSPSRMTFIFVSIVMVLMLIDV